MAIPLKMTPRQFAALELFGKIEGAIKDIEHQTHWHDLTERETRLVVAAAKKLMKEKMQELGSINNMCHKCDWIDNGY